MRTEGLFEIFEMQKTYSQSDPESNEKTIGLSSTGSGSDRWENFTWKTLIERQTERLNTIRTIYEQQKYLYENHTHRVADPIVSVSQPFVRPIVRRKAGKPVEFGAKLDISVVNGWTRLETYSFNAYNEAGNLQQMTGRFREREGHYPSRILADKIYRNRENLS